MTTACYPTLPVALVSLLVGSLGLPDAGRAQPASLDGSWSGVRRSVVRVRVHGEGAVPRALQPKIEHHLRSERYLRYRVGKSDAERKLAPCRRQ